jgi:hypothetical protein
VFLAALVFLTAAVAQSVTYGSWNGTSHFGSDLAIWAACGIGGAVLG